MGKLCFVCLKNQNEMHDVFIHGIGNTCVCGTHLERDNKSMIGLEEYKNLGREELAEMYRKRQVKRWA